MILVVGSINLDLVASVDRIPRTGETVTGKSFQTFFGGKGANQAVGAARLGQPVSMIGRLGDDEFGRRLRRGLSDAGVGVAAVKNTPGVSSGAALISVEAEGRNTIVVIPGANGKVTSDDLEKELRRIRSAAIILTQLEIPLETVEFLAEMAARCRVPLMLDPAPARKLGGSLLKKIAWLTPNETEACVLCGIEPGKLKPRNAGNYARVLLENGPRNVIIKMGSQGAYMAGADVAASQWVPAFEVQAVDSTAAGDAFNAGLAVALTKGEPALEAARFASAVAALSVTRLGAQPSMPKASEVRKFLRTMKKRYQ